MRQTLLKTIVLGFSIVTLFLIFDSRSEVARATKMQTPPEKTVGQVGKNIKVLTAMPESQLIPAMNFFSASMGRGCNYCHVSNQSRGHSAPAAKPEKTPARDMIKLVMDINKT